MASSLSTKRCRVALGAALAVAAVTTFAQAPEQPTAAPEAALLAQAGGTAQAHAPASEPTAVAYPALEAGVRTAAAEGPETLRRYVHRTRMIYAWYYPAFAK